MVVESQNSEAYLREAVQRSFTSKVHSLLWVCILLPSVGTATAASGQSEPTQLPAPAIPAASLGETQPAPFAQTTQPAFKEPTSTPQAAKSASSESQEDNAQVRTGSKLGEIQDLVSRLTNMLGDHRIPEMEELLEQSENAPIGTAGKLTANQTQMFRGVIANRENKPVESIRLLEPLVEQMDTTGKFVAADIQPDTRLEEKLVRKALAEDYLRAGDFALAAKSYAELESRMGASLTADEREELELPLKILPMLSSNPRMTVEPGEAFTLPYDRDAIGLTDVPVFVDAQSHDWMLDPTAPFNMICRSTAKLIGLKISADAVTVHTITGRPMQVRWTVIPRLTLGTVTYRNMTALVFEDADYFFPASSYLVRGVLGYPAVSALGSITITSNSRVEVQPGSKGERLNKGAHFFLDGDRVLVALGKPGDERMFVLDAAGQQTYLTSRYYAEHSDDFDHQKMQLLSVPGAQKKPPAPAYVADSVKMLVGDTPIELHYIQVLSEPLAGTEIDDTYGTLGLDALDELKSYTFDYLTMMFAVQVH